MKKKFIKFKNRLKKASQGVFSLGVLLFFVFSVPTFAVWYILLVIEKIGKEISILYPLAISLINSLGACVIVIILRVAMSEGSPSSLVIRRMAKRIGPILLFVLMIGSYLILNRPVAPVTAGWWNDAWAYRKIITINYSKVVADQVNFPVLVSFTDANLINHAQTDGDDFIFISSEGQKLSHEIEKYTSATGELMAWVKIPALSAANDTVLYLYYGNPTVGSQQDKINVWDNNFQGVWHLKERPDNNDGCGNNLACDSTRNAYSGTFEANMIAGDQITGKIDGSIDLDGTNNYITHGDVLDFNLTDQFTLSAWIKPSALPNSDQFNYIVSKQDTDSPYSGWGFFLFSNTGQMGGIYIDGSNETSTFSSASIITTGSWQYVSMVYNNETITFYKSGVAQSNAGSQFAATASTNTAVPLCVGCDDNATDELFEGTLDEVRVSRGIRSANWLQTEFNNQSSTSTFYAIQSEEVGPGPIVYLSFDEGYGTTVYDESGHGYAGTLSAGTSSPWQAEDLCLAGKCLYFDGYNDYVRISSGMITAYPFTLNAWVKAIGPSRDGTIMSLQDKDVANIMYGLYVDSSPQGAVQVRARNTTSYDNYGQKYLNDNKWHYLSGIFNTATDRKIYIDGEVQNIGSITSATYNTAVDSLDIGRWGSSTPSNYFTGFIDEVKIYPYARSANEIRQDYAAGLAGAGTRHGVSAAFGSKSDSWMADGLIGYWQFDESATTSGAFDASGNGYNRIFYNHASTTAGKFGRSAVFDGDDDTVNLSSTSFLNGVGKNFTYAGWVYISGTQWGNSQNFSVFSKDMTGSPYTVYFNVWVKEYSVNDSTKFGFGSESPDMDITSINSCVVGAWNFIAVTYDGQNLKTYFNGEFDNSVPETDALVDANENSGTDGTGVTSMAPIKVDEARVYNRALSPAEIRALYDWAPPPVAHWKFDEHQGTTAFDSAASTTFSGGNHGTLGGGTAAYRPAWTRGKYGSGLSFDGTDDAVNMGSPAVLDDLGPMTVSAWLKPQSESKAHIIAKDDDGSSNGIWAIYYNSSYSVYFNKDYGTNIMETIGTSLTGNTWQYFTLTWDGSDYSANVHMYVNGVEMSYGAGTNGTGGKVSDAAQGFVVGNAIWNTTGVNGAIDDVRVYNYVRTPKQIYEDMNAGHPAGGSPVGSELTYWSFDEGYGTTVYDSTIRAKALTLSSSTGWTLDGKFNRAYQGADNRRAADGADDADLDFTATEDFALSAWIRYTTTNPANTEYIIHKQTGSEGYALMMNGQGRLSFGIGDTSSALFPEDYASSTRDYADGGWHHVLGIKTSNTKIELYVDGILVAADTSLAANATLENAATLYIGDADAADGTNEFLGKIDEVKIFPYALSPDEIKLDYSGNSAVSMGALGTETAATSSNAQSLAYCVPGSTDYCAPPVGEWRMDEKSGTTTYDLSGNGNNGVFRAATSSPAWKGSGYCHSGNCLSFDGNDDYIEISSSTSLRIPNISVSAWFSSTYSGWSHLVAHEKTSWLSWNLNMNSNGKVSGFVGTDSGTNGPSVDSATGFNDGKWHYAVMTYDATTLKLYVDGRFIGQSTTNNGPIVYNDTDATHLHTHIGCHVYNAAPVLEGCARAKIDDVRIYNYARTPAQIAYDFNRGKPIAHWRFDECAGSTIYDDAKSWNGGTANNGQLILGSSGTTATGTCASSSNTFWYNGRSGKVNSAGSFDGTDDYISVANEANFDFTGTSTFSFSAWIYRETSDTEDEILGKYNNSTNWQGYSFFFPPDGSCNGGNGCLAFGLGYNSVSEDQILVASPNDAVSKNVWTHVAATYGGSMDADNVRIYVNGNRQNPRITYDALTGTTLNNNNLLIGNDLVGAADYFDGAIDEVKIFNYALTPLQVQTEYAGGAVRFGQ